MRVFSFIEQKSKLLPVEVEVALWPGLPVIQFLGRADSHLKESSLRIKSAIKAAGFEFPVAQQIVVNLRPTHVPKSSRGIELAVAAAYLWMSGQIPQPIIDESFFIYGELSLFGQVCAPESLKQANMKIDAGSAGMAVDQPTVLTGELKGKFGFRRWVARNLSMLRQPEMIPAEGLALPTTCPNQIDRMFFSEAEARLLEVLAIGGHHVMLAGPAGAGKSTLARALVELLPEPTQAELLEVLKLNPCARWRPLIEPHHSTPRAAMIGGGSVPSPGEVARAHLGVLLLDELLEFDRVVLEALREPFEAAQLRIGRVGGVEIYPLSAQIVGTTNLCPCGDFLPGEILRKRCRYPLRKCRSYADRLSGPLLDRFQIVFFNKPTQTRPVLGEQIRARVGATRARNANGRWNRELTLEELGGLLDKTVRSVGFTSRALSQRRYLATLRVAKSFADLAGKSAIGMEEVNEALRWTVEPFDLIQLWD